MAGAKETPRQKMIGMMYLVLTALLALNVSREILNAFVIVNDALVKTNQNFEKKNELLMTAFQNAYAENKTKVEPWLKKANDAAKLADAMIKDINDAKVELIKQSDGKEGGDTMNLMRVDAKDTYDNPTRIMCGVEESNPNGIGTTLKEKLVKFKKDMLALVPEKVAKEMNLGMNVDDAFNQYEDKVTPWEITNFYHTVLVADIVLLNNMIAQVLNAKADILSKLLEQISANDFKFDAIDGKVIPNANVVMRGSEYVADIFVAAYSTTQSPYVYLKTGVDTLLVADTAGCERIPGSGGKCQYKVTGGGNGEQKYAGLIRIKAPNGDYKFYPFKSAYMVQEPSGSVSADKMNVFYIGLENPITVSAAGVPSDKVKANMSSGGVMIPKGNGKFIVKPDAKAKEAVINVSADVQGKPTNMGQFKFRIKRVPSPIPTIAGKNGGDISRGVVAAAPFVLAQLDETFVFEGVKFNVLSFTVFITEGTNIKLSKPGCKGSKFDQTTINAIKAAKIGGKIVVDEIKAVGPDGQARNLPPVSLVFKN